MNWEYKVIQLNLNQAAANRELNDLGAQGWELVVCSGYRAYLKRPIPIVIKTAHPSSDTDTHPDTYSKIADSITTKLREVLR